MIHHNYNSWFRRMRRSYWRTAFLEILLGLALLCAALLAGHRGLDTVSYCLLVAAAVVWIDVLRTLRFLRHWSRLA